MSDSEKTSLTVEYYMIRVYFKSGLVREWYYDRAYEVRFQNALDEYLNYLKTGSPKFVKIDPIDSATKAGTIIFNFNEIAAIDLYKK